MAVPSLQQMVQADGAGETLLAPRGDQRRQVRYVTADVLSGCLQEQRLSRAASQASADHWVSGFESSLFGLHVRRQFDVMI
jgi:hypothetical protein